MSWKLVLAAVLGMTAAPVRAEVPETCTDVVCAAAVVSGGAAETGYTVTVRYANHADGVLPPFHVRLSVDCGDEKDTVDIVTPSDMAPFTTQQTMTTGVCRGEPSPPRTITILGLPTDRPPASRAPPPAEPGGVAENLGAFLRMLRVVGDVCDTVGVCFSCLSACH